MNGDTDRTAYTVAFGPEGFLMVFNPKRNGWEMPGGHIREGESAQEGARREFLEEAGYGIEIVQSREMPGCTVFAAKVSGNPVPAEMECRFFRELPGDLAFAREEYLTEIPWAREKIRCREHRRACDAVAGSVKIK